MYHSERSSHTVYSNNLSHATSDIEQSTAAAIECDSSLHVYTEADPEIWERKHNSPSHHLPSTHTPHPHSASCPVSFQAPAGSDRHGKSNYGIIRTGKASSVKDL